MCAVSRAELFKAFHPIHDGNFADFSDRNNDGICNYVFLHHALGLKTPLCSLMNGHGNPGGEAVRQWLMEYPEKGWSDLKEILREFWYFPEFLSRVFETVGDTDTDFGASKKRKREEAQRKMK